MASEQPIRVAIIGLGFGAEFIPIYQQYPGAEVAAICRRSQERPRRVRRPLADRQALHRLRSRFSDDPEIDAVHINSPIQDHAPQSLAALKAGKHVACTVPMATSIDDCRQIVEAQRRSGKVYMMMETVVYSREYLFVKQMYDQRRTRPRPVPPGAATSRTWQGWPGYWEGLPPMHYATHCVSPCLRWY